MYLSEMFELGKHSSANGLLTKTIGLRMNSVHRLKICLSRKSKFRVIISICFIFLIIGSNQKIMHLQKINTYISRPYINVWRTILLFLKIISITLWACPINTRDAHQLYSGYFHFKLKFEHFVVGALPLQIPVRLNLN